MLETASGSGLAADHFAGEFGLDEGQNPKL
jgi:hypothetical protein